MARTKTIGRPRGRKTQSVAVVPAAASRCPRCASTEREPYFNRREVPASGVSQDGAPYNRVVWRRTRCSGCGQVRDDRSYELAPPPKASGSRRTGRRAG